MKALVVGAGRMGAFHRRVLRDLGLDVSTVDPDPAAGADYRTVPTRDVDVVCVAVPIAQLAEQAACWAGHAGWLLIEKPGAPTLRDARALADMLAGQRVAVGYVERFNPRVRALKAWLDGPDGPVATRARFTRWNDRPSPDVLLDLQSHDMDLARFLALRCPITYDAAADRPPKRREIEVTIGAPWLPVRVDLTAHDISPLHAQWHAFLSDRPGYATPADAVAVLDELAEHQAVAA